MLALLRWLSRWQLSTLHALGALLGWLVYAASPTYRRRLQHNARRAGLSPAQRREAVVAAGRMVAELPWLWLRPPGRPLGDAVRWDGRERIAAALDAGQGLILLTPHLGCWEVCAQAIAEAFGERVPLTAMYRPARQAWLRAFEEGARARPGLATAPAALAGVRQMIRALRKGEMVGLLPDQVPPEGMGVWAPFYGEPAYTMTLASRLQQQTGAALLLIWADRLPQGAGYRVQVLAPEQLDDAAPGAPAGPPPASPAADEAARQLAEATRINRLMERLIARRPGQYLWGYHRYKQPRPSLADGQKG